MPAGRPADGPARPAGSAGRAPKPHARRVPFDGIGSRSSRASTTLCTEPGSAASPPELPASSSCSRKSGWPADRSMTAERRRLRRRSPKCAASALASVQRSGPRSKREERADAGCDCARRRSSGSPSVRAVVTSTAAQCSAAAARVAVWLTMRGGAQCMSSSTMKRGLSALLRCRRLASASLQAACARGRVHRVEQRHAMRAAAAVAAARTGDSSCERRRPARVSQRPLDGRALGLRPVAPCTSSRPSTTQAHRVALRHRRRSRAPGRSWQVKPSAMAMSRNSSTSRVLPMPGSPRTWRVRAASGLAGMHAASR